LVQNRPQRGEAAVNVADGNQSGRHEKGELGCETTRSHAKSVGTR
jgi:hypothetical protein